jgi:hypothetical protein
VLRDAAGWRELGDVLADYPQPIFALDYSIASQISYYLGRPAYTAWGQYRIWGIPPFQDALIVGLDYLPEAAVTERLRRAFQTVDGPQRLRYEQDGVSKEVRLWLAEGLKWEQEVFLEEFDFLNLLGAAR